MTFSKNCKKAIEWNRWLRWVKFESRARHRTSCLTTWRLFNLPGAIFFVKSKVVLNTKQQREAQITIWEQPFIDFRRRILPVTSTDSYNLFPSRDCRNLRTNSSFCQTRNAVSSRIVWISYNVKKLGKKQNFDKKITQIPAINLRAIFRSLMRHYTEKKICSTN